MLFGAVSGVDGGRRRKGVRVVDEQFRDLGMRIGLQAAKMQRERKRE